MESPLMTSLPWITGNLFQENHIQELALAKDRWAVSSVTFVNDTVLIASTAIF